MNEVQIFVERSVGEDSFQRKKVDVKLRMFKFEIMSS